MYDRLDAINNVPEVELAHSYRFARSPLPLRKPEPIINRCVDAPTCWESGARRVIEIETRYDMKLSNV